MKAPCPLRVNSPSRASKIRFTLAFWSRSVILIGILLSLGACGSVPKADGVTINVLNRWSDPVKVSVVLELAADGKRVGPISREISANYNEQIFVPLAKEKAVKKIIVTPVSGDSVTILLDNANPPIEKSVVFTRDRNMVVSDD